MPSEGRTWEGIIVTPRTDEGEEEGKNSSTTMHTYLLRKQLSQHLDDPGPWGQVGMVCEEQKQQLCLVHSVCTSRAKECGNRMVATAPGDNAAITGVDFHQLTSLSRQRDALLSRPFGQSWKDLAVSESARSCG